MTHLIPLTMGSGGSAVVNNCQVCGGRNLQSALFLGYMPPVNQMRRIGQRPHEQPSYPAELLYCPDCELVQIGLVVDPQVLFPPDYPYTSGTTKILHRNFAEMAEECRQILGAGPGNLIVDIGSNDGTLLSKFRDVGLKVQGIEPTDAGKLAVAAGIPTEPAYFGTEIARRVCGRVGPADIVTACNCFAHIENIDDIVAGIVELMGEDGVFISENHYLIALLETVQYDTIYHEHLRYYSLASLENLLARHGLEVFHAKRIPTHGGSFRSYAARKGRRRVLPSVAEIREAERRRGPMPEQLKAFRRQVIASKLELHALLRDIKAKGNRICGISAPSRASTLAHYVGLDDGLIDYIAEIKGSQKIGRYLPGTLIPVVEESRMFADQPEYALLLAWHIAGDVAPKLRELGFKGKFIVPLPTPRVI
jgi:hypothetical protein